MMTNTWAVNLGHGTRTSDDLRPGWIMLKDYVGQMDLLLMSASQFCLRRETPKWRYPSNPGFTLGGVSLFPKRAWV